MSQLTSFVTAAMMFGWQIVAAIPTPSTIKITRVKTESSGTSGEETEYIYISKHRLLLIAPASNE